MTVLLGTGHDSIRLAEQIRRTLVAEVPADYQGAVSRAVVQVDDGARNVTVTLAEQDISAAYVIAGRLLAWLSVFPVPATIDVSGRTVEIYR